MVSLILLSALLVFGVGGALGGAYSVAHEPTSVLAWLMALVGVGVGGLVAFACFMTLVTLLLQVAVPAFVEGVGSHLRVRTWTPQRGHVWAFRRTDVLIPRAELTDVGFVVGQDGEPMLFLVHVSGHSFATSWSANERTVTAVAAQLSNWIAYRR